jgi:CRISPR-associated protein Cas5d
MAFGIALKVWGDYACFTRPEMKVERVSYDVITPSAARGILEAIYWKPAIQWEIERIHVLKKIQFTNVRRNELTDKIPISNIKEAIDDPSFKTGTYIEDERQQRAGIILKDVTYIIEAHINISENAGSEDPHDAKPQKHVDIFKRRASGGKCFHQPYLGTREFPAYFDLIAGEIPATEMPPDQRNRDLGWMLYDIDFNNDMESRFYRPKLKDGIINVPPYKEVFK